MFIMMATRLFFITAVALVTVQGKREPAACGKPHKLSVIEIESNVSNDGYQDIEAQKSKLANTRNKSVYLAKLAEQAERYDEMARYMEAVVDVTNELSVEERNLLSNAAKYAVDSRRAAWRIMSSAEQKEKTNGNEDEASYARDYRIKVEKELQWICDTIVNLLGEKLIPKTPSGESKVFYLKMKADYYRYIAEFTIGDKKTQASEAAKEAYEEATKIAEKDLGVTHPIRLGLALNYSVFMYEILNQPEQAYTMAKTAFDDAITKIEQIPDDKYYEVTSIMQHLRDNMSLWSSELSS